jgi:uncharacterized protein YyaL (SSP411 family)
LEKGEDSPLFVQFLCEALLRTYDITHDVKYLNAVRREASYAYKVGRDPQGGYWEHWTDKPHDPAERKTLIINASAARIFWLLTAYPDDEQLTKDGISAASKGKLGKAEDLLQQALGQQPEQCRGALPSLACPEPGA